MTILQRAIEAERERRRPTDTVQTSIRFPADVHDQITALGEQEEIPFNSLVTSVLREALAEMKR